MVYFLSGICLLGIGLFIFLVLAINNKPTWAIGVEIVGYLLLTISLLWGFVVSETEDIANGQSDIILNEKLNMLWDFERKKTDNIEEKDHLDLYRKHIDMSKRWYYLDRSGQWVSIQEKFANRSQYFLVGISTVCIASSRMSEVFISRRKKKRVVQGVYRNSRKRRGNIK